MRVGSGVAIGFAVLALAVGCGAGSSSGPALMPPVVASFTATPPAIAAGGSSTLAWSVSGADAVAIDQGIGTVTGSSRPVSPAVTTTYTLTATNGAGSSTAQVTVTVQPAPARPVIASFTATPPAIAAGGSSTLAWSVSGADAVAIDQGIGPVTGSSRPVSPAVTTTYTLTATNGAGSSTAQVTVTVGAASGFVTIDPSGRHLLRNGIPWRIQAAAAWSLPVGASLATIQAYFDNLQANGFNAIYMMAIVHQGGYGYPSNAPATLAGLTPFTPAGDFRHPNEPYWAFIDAILAAADARGIVVLLTPTYLGIGTNDGWDAEVAAQTQQVNADFGTWLGTRFGSTPNLIWLGLGDRTPSGSARTNHLAMIAAIQAVARQPWMAEASGYGASGYAGDSSPALVADVGSDIAGAIGMHSYYAYGHGYGDSYGKAYECYLSTPAKPVWPQEVLYEDENNTGLVTGAAWETQRTRFWGVLGGATAGDGYGWRDHWRSLNLATVPPGMPLARQAFALFASVRWWLHVPQPASGMGTTPAIVTGGRGTAYGGSHDWVTASVASDGTSALVYLPPTGTATRQITVDMSLLAGTVDASWWDPNDGSSTVIGAYANTGTRDFTTRGANSSGTRNDWVLVLRQAP